MSELRIRLGEHGEDMLVEVIATGDHAVHVMFLILHRSEQHRIHQVDHLRDAAARRPEEFALCRRGARDLLVRRAQVLAQEFGFGGQIHALTVRGEHAVLNVHARIERQFAHFAQDDALIGRLLCVAGHEHDPPHVECGVNVVVTAMHVERVLGQRAGAHLQHHRRELARRVVVLLHRVDESLPRRKVDRASPRDRERRGPALRRVLTFGFGSDLLMAPDIELAGGVRRLIDLAALGGGGDGIKHPALGDARLDVLRDKLIPTAGDVDAGVLVFGVLRRGSVGRDDGFGHGWAGRNGFGAAIWATE